MIDFENYTLGESNDHIEIETSDDNKRAALAIVKQAKRSIHLLSYDLDSVVYNDADFVDSLKTLAVRDRHSYVKILIINSEQIVNHGHRLIELSRQLSSFVHIRKLGDISKPINHAWLIADETALLYRSVALRYDGYVNFNDRRECRQLLTQFHEVWEQSAPDPELQQLHI